MAFTLEKLRDLALQQGEQLLCIYTQLGATQKECDRLRGVIDDCAKEWMRIDGIPFEGGIDGAMRAAVGEINRLRAELAGAHSRIEAMKDVGDDLSDAIERFAEASYAFADDPGENQDDPKAVAERRRQEELQALIARKINALKTERDRLAGEFAAARAAAAEVDRAGGDAPHEPAMGLANWIRARAQLAAAKKPDCDSVLPMSIDDGTRITVDSIAGGPWPPAYVRLRRIHDSKGDELASYAIENRLSDNVVKAAEALLGSEFVSTSPDGSWRFIRFSDTAILELRNAVQQARAAKKPAGSPR